MVSLETINPSHRLATVYLWRLAIVTPTYFSLSNIATAR